MACTMHSSASFPDRPVPRAKVKIRKKCLSIELLLQIHILILWKWAKVPLKAFPESAMIWAYPLDLVPLIKGILDRCVWTVTFGEIYSLLEVSECTFALSILIHILLNLARSLHSWFFIVMAISCLRSSFLVSFSLFLGFGGFKKEA